MSTESKPLLRRIPENRTYSSVLHHFEVERGIARRLKQANRQARKGIYCSMYDELFAQVPDHPRLTRRADDVLNERHIAAKTKLLKPLIRSDATFLEFGAGDCRFAFAMAKRFRQVHAIDIADQIGAGSKRPENFRLTVYDGYELDLPDDSIDVAFSDQLIEHLHPEDTAQHLQLVRRVLKPGGVYLFRTPHRLTGPHDVSRYFSEEAQGFHLKEWTYGELSALLQDLGYNAIRTYWFGKGVFLRIPLGLFRSVEAIFQGLPRPVQLRVLPYLLPSIVIAVEK